LNEWLDDLQVVSSSASSCVKSLRSRRKSQFLADVRNVIFPSLSGTTAHISPRVDEVTEWVKIYPSPQLHSVIIQFRGIVTQD
jgi:hypothetical protein